MQQVVVLVEMNYWSCESVWIWFDSNASVHHCVNVKLIPVAMCRLHLAGLSIPSKPAERDESKVWFVDAAGAQQCPAFILQFTESLR